MSEALQSGLTWDEDPDGNRLASPGRTIGIWLRSREEPHVYALFKYPSPRLAEPDEIYGVGMERVAYGLGTQLGLPIPRTHLETHDGHVGSLQWRVPDSRDLLTAGSCVMLLNKITNEDLWPVAAAFDIWFANVDRRPPNVLVEPLPMGTEAKFAQQCRFWLIDHGCCGLFPPAKFDQGLAHRPLGEITVGARDLVDERWVRDHMDVRLRNSLLRVTESELEQVLDRVRAVSDDAIDMALGEIPEQYVTRTQAEMTADLLKARRDRIDELVQRHWLVP